MAKRKIERCISEFFGKRPRPSPLSEGEPEKTKVSTPKSQRKSGFDNRWKSDFPWVVESSDGKGMLCDLCVKFQRRPKKCVPGRAVWVDIPCTSIRRQSCVHHGDSDAHKEASVFAAAAATTGGIEAGFCREEDINKKAMVAQMTVLYMLCKEEISLTTKLGPVLEVFEHIGGEITKVLQKGNNQKYTSMRHITDLVTLFHDVIWEAIVQDVRSSPYFSIMVDETTDITTTSQLIIYVRYLKDGKSHTSFGGTMELRNGRADTIREVIMQYLTDNRLPLNRMCAFGSDGAAVMVGINNGVAAQLKREVPHLLANHCVAHRLALASAQAAAAIPYLQKFKRIVEQLYRFYNYSAVRTATLKEIQNVLNEPSVKLTEAKDVRWLSHDKAVSAIRRCLPALVTSLEYEANEKVDAQAAGLLKFMQKFEFVAAVHMMCDILPVLSALSRCFQTRDGTYSTVGSLVAGTIASIRALKTTPGQHYSSLPEMTRSLEDQPFMFGVPSDRQKEEFHKNVYIKYLDSVVENLERRFPDINELDAFRVFNPQTWPEDMEEFELYGNQEIEMLSERFHTSLPDHIMAITEFRQLKNAVKASRDQSQLQTGTQIMELAAGTLANAYPTLAKIATVGLLVPASTADCERGFSALKRVKTEKRNRLKTSSLNSLLMVTIEGPSPLNMDFEKAVDKWAKEKNRRLAL